jgi:hypothetical protein
MRKTVDVQDVGINKYVVPFKIKTISIQNHVAHKDVNFYLNSLIQKTIQNKCLNFYNNLNLKMFLY